MADVPMRDDNALRLARGAGGVDGIGGIVAGGGARRNAIAIFCKQRLENERLAVESRCKRGLLVMRQQPFGAAIGKADGNAVRRGGGIEGDVGGTCLEDRKKRDMKFERTLEPQADEIARANTAAGKRLRSLVRQPVEFGVAHRLRRSDQGQRRLLGAASSCRLEYVHEGFIADKLRPNAA